MGKYTPSTGGGGGGGGTVSVAEKYGVQGDYATHYGILDCPNGLITYSLGKDIVIEPGIVLQAAGSDTKTTIASAINYTIVEDTDVTLFYAEGTILEAGAVYYQTEEPTDGDVGYLAWFNPEIMQWQFKSDDTGNVWRTAVATPIANVRIVDGNITRLDYMGYRILDDDILAHQKDIDELEALLDEKQNLLNTTDPIRIGTTTIGEPNNITVLNDKLVPLVQRTVSTSYDSNTSSTKITFTNYTVNSTNFDEEFNTRCYFDIPLNFSNYFTDDYSEFESLLLFIKGMTSMNNSNAYHIYVGQLSEDGFKPYIMTCKYTNTGSTASPNNYLGIATGLHTPIFLSSGTTTSSFLVPTSAYTTGGRTQATSSSATGREVGFSITKQTNGTLSFSVNSENLSYYHYLSLSNITSDKWDLVSLQNCNVIRVVMYAYTESANTTAYHPSASNTYLTYRGIGDTKFNTLDWNIEDGIVTTYGLSLKMDNQTITTNANGELTVNMDELGNEVNAISGRVTTLETNMGGLKLQKKTQAEYEALVAAGTVDENTMYLIVDDTTA